MNQVEVAVYTAAINSPDCLLVVHLKNKEKIEGKLVVTNSDFLIIKESNDELTGNVFHTISRDSILYFTVFA